MEEGAVMRQLLVNSVSEDGMRLARWIGDAPFAEGWAAGAVKPFRRPLVNERRWSDALLGTHYVEVTWPMAEPVHDSVKWFLGWRVLDGQRLSEAILQASQVFALAWRKSAQYALVRCLPAGAEVGMDVFGCVLGVNARVLRQCVFIGG